MSVRGLNPLLQVSPYESDGGNLVGRDPRFICAKDWEGSQLRVGLKAIRAKCLDCAGVPGEVRKCVQTGCPLWPLRMGTVPKGFKLARQGRISSDKSAGRTSIPTEPEGNETGTQEPNLMQSGGLY